MDTFGDGFNTGKMFIFDDYNGKCSTAPDCDHNPVSQEYCFQPSLMKDGDSVTATVSGVNPKQRWEVIVKLSILEIFSLLFHYFNRCYFKLCLLILGKYILELTALFYGSYFEKMIMMVIL